MTRKKHLVVSAVNLIEGGTLTILRECLQAASRELSEHWEITALVHKSSLVDVPGIKYIEYPEIKKSWISRIKFEYVDCRALSKDLKADFWLALHDISPRVATPRQAVYCHNAMCFYRMSAKEVWRDPKLLLFSLFYGYLYRLNIKANERVIVQQDWIRKEFLRQHLHSQIVVAHPVDDASNHPTPIREASPRRAGSTRFFYPSFPRVFKNFELLMEAWEILCMDPEWDGHLIVTIDGLENKYARGLHQRFKKLRNLTFSGRLSFSEMQHHYSDSDCMIFPSRLETWGLPLTEAKRHGLAILVADLPYAHEAIGSYDQVGFFDPTSAEQLAAKMLQFSKQRSGRIWPEHKSDSIADPYARNWPELLKILLSEPSPRD